MIDRASRDRSLAGRAVNGAARQRLSGGALFAKSAPSVRVTYDAILKASLVLGPVVVEPKKTSFHLVRRTAFAGIEARRDSLILTVKSATEILGPRVHRAERTSANRWHVEIRMASPKEIDKEVRGWSGNSWLAESGRLVCRIFESWSSVGAQAELLKVGQQ